MKHPVIALLLAMTFSIPAGAQSIELIQNGTSRYVIYHEATAPRSVTRAATELQDYLHRSSGAKLPIVTRPAPKMISLADNAASRAAGFSASNIPWEGFRIVTKDSNVYLIGRDTADRQRTPNGGRASGTYNATCEFLERFVGVRWLIPGEHGDYVPKHTDLRIPETDVSDAPAMQNRRVPYTQERRPDVQQWWHRQRLGWSLYLNHSHNWRHTIPPSHFEQHPEWFPMRAGVRVPPTGRYKLCTTNAELVRAYADATIAFFDRSPSATCYSLSPSDSSGYCECEHCSALYEIDPHGKRSVTPAILTFYNDVAKLVAQKYPDKILAGYVYAEYLFPPKKTIKLEPNVFLVWAPSFDYGFTLARPELQQQWEQVLAQWTEVTHNLAYYDLPVNISTEAGALNPPGLEILKFLYPRLQAAEIKGVYVYGISAWGRAAPLNYLLAKLAWNPQADVEALFDEYCVKAYGAGGQEINRMFRGLDREVARHYREFPNASYTLTPDMMRDIYAKNLPQIERLYRSAEAKIQDTDAKARLAMIGDNLTVLHWNLRQHDLLDEPKRSSFFLSDADFFAFLSSHQGSLALHPGTSSNAPSYVKTKQSVDVPPKSQQTEAVRPFRLRGDQHLILRPTTDAQMEVKFSRMATRGKLVTYSVYRPDGTAVTSGLMSDEVPLVLEADGAEYYHLVISAGTASFMIKTSGAAWAVDSTLSDQGLHLLGTATPLYFYVTEQTPAFHLSLEATPPGETAVATLYAPDGQTVTEFDCTKISVDRQKIKVATGQTGWWKLEIQKPAIGQIDDVWVKLTAPHSGYFSLDPAQAAAVR